MIPRIHCVSLSKICNVKILKQLKQQISELHKAQTDSNDDSRYKAQIVALQNKRNRQMLANEQIASESQEKQTIIKQLKNEILTLNEVVTVMQKEEEFQTFKNNKLKQEIMELKTKIAQKYHPLHRDKFENDKTYFAQMAEDYVQQNTGSEVEQKMEEIQPSAQSVTGNRWTFAINEHNTNKFELIDDSTLKYKAGFTLYCYWTTFGPLLKGSDKRTVEFEIVKHGSAGSCHKFGFATPKFCDYTDIYPNHVAVIDGAPDWRNMLRVSKMCIKDEFAAVNVVEDIPNAIECFDVLGSAAPRLWIKVDMKERKGWIEDTNYKIEINLPEEVYIILGFSGNEEKIVRVAQIS